jgi:integrase
MPQSITTCSEMFLRRKVNLSAGSMKMYRRVFSYLIDCFGDIDPQALTLCDIDDYIDFLQSREYRGRAIKPESVNAYLRHSRAFFNWMHRRQRITENPFKEVEFLGETGNEEAPFEDREIEALFRACGSERWRLIIALAAHCGLRSGEILNLTLTEIDYDSGTITVKPKPSTEETWEWTIKDHESRKVPITPLVEGLLTKVQGNLPDKHPYVTLSPARYKHLLEMKKTGKLKYEHRKLPVNNFRREFFGICNKAGVRFRKFHSLRGSYLTKLAEAGLPVHEVSKLAGHASIETTLKHYLKPREGYLDRAKAVFSKMSDEGLEPSTR